LKGDTPQHGKGRTLSRGVGDVRERQELAGNLIDLDAQPRTRTTNDAREKKGSKAKRFGISRRRRGGNKSKNQEVRRMWRGPIGEEGKKKKKKKKKTLKGKVIFV